MLLCLEITNHDICSFVVTQCTIHKFEHVHFHFHTQGISCDKMQNLITTGPPRALNKKASGSQRTCEVPQGYEKHMLKNTK